MYADARVCVKLAPRISRLSCLFVKIRSQGRFKDKFWESKEEETGVIDPVSYALFLLLRLAMLSTVVYSEAYLFSI